jgi:hypothetical protein
MVKKTLSGQPDKTYSLRSRLGLNAANSFQAEAVGVVLPPLNTYIPFIGFAVLALLAAAAFQFMVPETKSAQTRGAAISVNA